MIYGAAAWDYTGYSVAAAGDVNGDKMDDFIVGAHLAYPGGLTYAGAAYVLFGHNASNPFPDTVDLASLVSGAATGFNVTGGAANDQLGYCVSGAGDVNGDGFDDVIVGAHLEDFSSRQDAGAAYVIFGHSTATAFMNIAVESFVSGALGFRIFGAVANDYAGYSVSGAGDYNRDGYDDVIVGAPNVGISYVIFGHSGAYTDIDLLSFTSSATGFRILGAQAYFGIGYSVSGAGDVNHDGFDDVVVGAYGSEYSGRVNTGAAFVIFGRRGVPAFADVDLATMVYGTLGFRIFGALANDQLGIAVSGAGDVNGDGIDDVLVGAAAADALGRSNSGSAVVIFGHSNSSTFPDIDTLSSLGELGYRIYGAAAGDLFGLSVSAAGDVNHDGIGDFLVGAVNALQYAGSAYAIFGTNSALTRQPSSQPTSQHPSITPTSLPTEIPSTDPTLAHTINPTTEPTATPTSAPSSPTAAPTISSCPPGTHYESLASTDVCIDCPAGSYSNTVGGAATCTKCALGEFAENPRSSRCESCPQGSYADAEGSVACSSCPAGTFYNTTGATSFDSCRLCDAGSTSTERASICTFCPAGSHALNAGSSSCSACTAGTYSDTEGTTSCSDCAAGFYTEGDAARVCAACPISTYSPNPGGASAQACIPCPANRVTSTTASTQLAQCLNPAANFAQGALALFLSLLVSVLYIFLGRMNAVAYGRMRYIQKAGEIYIALIKAIESVAERRVQETRTKLSRAILFWSFVVGCIFLFIAIVALLAVTSFGQIFFSAMIMFRNVHLSLPTIDFVTRVEVALADLDALLGVNVSYAFGWIFVMFDALASLSINLDFANVTCIGAQAPIQLLINLVLFIAIVILIECDVAAFLESTFYKAHQDFRKLVLNNKVQDTVDYPAKMRWKMWLRSFAECTVLKASTVVYILQYSLSFMSVGQFFAYYGRHASSPSCDTINGAPKIDTALAIGSSVLAYLLVPAILYNIIKLLAPRLAAGEKYEGGKQGFSHEHTIGFIDRHPVTLSYSPVPHPDVFLSWRFRWAYDVLHTTKYTKPDELMLIPPGGVTVDRPIGIGLCPLVSNTTQEFQEDWKAECQQRLPEYGLFFSRACILYARVLWLNVWTFACVVAGYWNSDSVDKFDLLGSIRASGMETPRDVRISRSISSVSVLLSFYKLLYRAVTCGGSYYAEGKYTVPEDGGESRNLVSRMISAKLSTRATLCLLIPFGGLITTYVSFTAAYPIFCCQDKSLNRSLPGLIVFDSYLLADKRVRQMGSYAKWKVQFMSWFIFVTESRLLQYLYNLMLYLMSVSVLFYPVERFLMVGALVILFYCMVCSLFPIVVLGNMLGVHDDNEYKIHQEPTSVREDLAGLELSLQHSYDCGGDDDEESCIDHTQLLSTLSVRRELGESSRSLLDTAALDSVPSSSQGDNSKEGDDSDDEVHSYVKRTDTCFFERQFGGNQGAGSRLTPDVDIEAAELDVGASDEGLTAAGAQREVGCSSDEGEEVGTHQQQVQDLDIEAAEVDVDASEMGMTAAEAQREEGCSSYESEEFSTHQQQGQDLDIEEAAEMGVTAAEVQREDGCCSDKSKEEVSTQDQDLDFEAAEVGVTAVEVEVLAAEAQREEGCSDESEEVSTLQQQGHESEEVKTQREREGKSAGAVGLALWRRKIRERVLAIKAKRLKPSSSIGSSRGNKRTSKTWRWRLPSQYPTACCGDGNHDDEESCTDHTQLLSTLSVRRELGESSRSLLDTAVLDSVPTASQEEDTSEYAGADTEVCSCEQGTPTLFERQLSLNQCAAGRSLSPDLDIEAAEVDVDASDEGVTAVEAQREVGCYSDESEDVGTHQQPGQDLDIEAVEVLAAEAQRDEGCSDESEEVSTQDQDLDIEAAEVGVTAAEVELVAAGAQREEGCYSDEGEEVSTQKQQQQHNGFRETT